MKNKAATLTRLLAAGSDDLSFDKIRNILRQALPNMYLREVFPDHVIAEEDNTETNWQIPYAIGEDGEQVTFGQRVEVEQKYVKVEAAARFTAAADQNGSADYGYKWLVQIVEAGTDKQGIANYSLQVLTAAVPVYEGARVFALSQGQHDDPANPYGKSVRDLVGWLSDVKPNATGLQGIFNILKSAQWLRDLTVDAWERGKKDLIGLSHDVLAKTKAGRSQVKEVEQIVRVDSVDVVYDPIAGGKLLRMAAAAKAGRKEEDTMDRLLAALKAQRPDLYASIEDKITGKTVTEEEIIKLLCSAQAAGTGADDEKLKSLVAAAVQTAMAGTGNQAADAVLEQARILACGLTLKEELTNSKLPDISQDKIKAQFDGKSFELTTLQAAIKTEKEYVDKLTASGSVTGSGQIRVIGCEPERIQAAMDKMLGVVVTGNLSDVPALTSLRSAYTQITGDAEVRGVPSRDGVRFGESFMDYMRLPAAYASSSFSYVLGNSLYRRLVQDYKAVDYNEQALISYKRNARDFKTLESIRVGYFGDLPDVSPETEDYNEITMATDEEITYAVNQKGVILTVTRRVIINDDLKSVQLLVSRLGRAARRTFARRGWNKITNNATYKADSLALFHSSHSNLGSTALTNDSTGIATLTARLVAMFAQTEKDSAETLGLEPKYLWLPRAVLEIAKALNSPWPIAGTVNPHAGRFGANHERIIVNKLTADPNDWGLIADPNDVELMEVAFLNGQEEPELFVADNPLVGQMFVGDKVQYKMRHEYEWEIADYRGFDKSVCA